MKHLVYIITLIFSLGLISCQKDIDINDCIDQNAEFDLSIRTVDTDTGFSTSQSEKIKVESEKWIKLINFAKNNLNGWQSSPASHIGDVYVSQGSFKLTYTKGSSGVVISFNDKDNNPKQYIKKINKGELDFLVE